MAQAPVLESTAGMTEVQRDAHILQRLDDMSQIQSSSLIPVESSETANMPHDSISPQGLKALISHIRGNDLWVLFINLGNFASTRPELMSHYQRVLGKNVEGWEIGRHMAVEAMCCTHTMLNMLQVKPHWSVMRAHGKAPSMAPHESGMPLTQKSR